MTEPTYFLCELRYAFIFRLFLTEVVVLTAKYPNANKIVLSAPRRVDYMFCLFNHRQPKLNIREPLNYKDSYGNTTDLCKMVEANIVLSIKST